MQDQSSQIQKTVPLEMSGFRCDKAAALLFSEFSRTQIQDLIARKMLLCNQIAIKKRDCVKVGDVLSLSEESFKKPAALLVPSKIDFTVLYEDEDLFVINKPARLVVHPGAGHYETTFVQGFLYQCPEIALAEFEQEERPGLVHRLDKDTSGVLIAAKNKHALWNISRQFQERTVYKEYIALVWGRFCYDEKKVITHIGRSAVDRKKMAVVEGSGKEAISFVYREMLFHEASRIRVDLKTGRTHQIRVHLQHLGYPIIGDEVYTSSGLKNKFLKYASRQMLHCHKITIQHPKKNIPCTFIADMPLDMKECEKKLSQ